MKTNIHDEENMAKASKQKDRDKIISDSELTANLILMMPPKM